MDILVNNRQWITVPLRHVYENLYELKLDRTIDLLFSLKFPQKIFYIYLPPGNFICCSLNETHELMFDSPLFWSGAHTSILFDFYEPLIAEQPSVECLVEKLDLFHHQWLMDLCSDNDCDILKYKLNRSM